MTIPDLAHFRRADSHQSNFSTSEELRSTLQRRLQAFGWILVVYTSGVAFLSSLSPLLRARTAAHPFSVGSTYFYVIVASLLAISTIFVRPRTPRTLRWLRVGGNPTSTPTCR